MEERRATFFRSRLRFLEKVSLQTRELSSYQVSN